MQDIYGHIYAVTVLRALRVCGCVCVCVCVFVQVPREDEHTPVVSSRRLPAVRLSVFVATSLDAAESSQSPR